MTFPKDKDMIHVRKNPLFPGLGMCDPHAAIFNNELYLFTGHDALTETDGFCAVDWHVWRTANGVDFEHCCTIRPEDTYIGRPYNQCWASDAAEKNGKYYFYFSECNRSIGVMVSDRPDGGYRDALGAPLVPNGSTPTMEYDPHVFVDEDGTPYLIFGGPKWAYGDAADGYYIARLQDRMTALAETPKKVEVDHPADDKPALHRFGGRYYLSWASHYAVSENIYGPYTYVGNMGVAKDHGTFFEWNNQWFNSFTIYDPIGYHRAPGLCYVHYRENGEMVSDSLIAEYGIGQYDADWSRISAAWYMAASRWMKREGPNGGFELRGMRDGDWVTFPQIHHIPADAGIYFCARVDADAPCTLEVRRKDKNGELLAECPLSYTGAPQALGYPVTGAALHGCGETEDLCLVVRGTSETSLTLDAFSVAAQ